MIFLDHFYNKTHHFYRGMQNFYVHCMCVYVAFYIYVICMSMIHENKFSELLTLLCVHMSIDILLRPILWFS